MSLGPAAQLVAFTLLSLIALLGALGMATTMSMFRSGLFLMASFIGTAGLFILLSADLLGVLQVMMYIGGMLVMVLFMVLFMHDPGGSMMAGMKLPLVERLFSRGLLPEEPGGDGPPAHAAHPHAGHDPQPEPAPPLGHPGGGTTRHAGHSAAPTHDAMNHHGAPGASPDPSVRVPATPGGAPRAGASDPGHTNHDPEETAATEPEHAACRGVSHEKAGHGSMDHEAMDHQGMTPGGMDMSGMSMVTPVRPWAALLGILTGVFFVVLLLLRPAWPTVATQPDPNSAEQVGLLLMDKYMMAFEGAGLLILLGIFGAVYLGRPDRHPSASGRDAHVGVDEPPPGLDDDTLKPLTPPPPHDPHAQGGSA